MAVRVTNTDPDVDTDSHQNLSRTLVSNTLIWSRPQHCWCVLLCTCVSRPDRLRDIADRFNLDQDAVLDNVLYARAYTSKLSCFFHHFSTQRSHLLSVFVLYLTYISASTSKSFSGAQIIRQMYILRCPCFHWRVSYFILWILAVVGAHYEQRL